MPDKLLNIIRPLRILEAEEAEFRIAFERLLICNHILAKAVVPLMKDIKFGRIINIISTSVKQVIRGLGVSNTIRGSVAQWAKTLALELGEFGITVNNILPGYTKTNRLNELALKNADNENVNMLSCYIAKNMGTKKSFARVQDGSMKNELEELKIDQIIDPSDKESIALRETAELIRNNDKLSPLLLPVRDGVMIYQKIE